MSSVVDAATSSSEAVPPLSPASSSDLSLEESEPYLSAKPLSLPPAPGSPMRFSKGGMELPALQVAGGDPDGLEPIAEEELDPGSFDLVMPVEQNSSTTGKYKLEKRSELLFSSRHLEAIFDDSAELYRFSQFLYKHRPASVPLLTYFLEALKALRAIEYSNAVLSRLGPLTDFEFTHEYFQAHPTTNQELKTKANAAFDILAREDLPMYITHVWIETVSVSIKHRIMGMPSHASEGLAEVFCLTDPSRHDNPIVFMSEEFNRTTQYGVDYVVGRNCRFLQGPYTNPFSVTRIREKVEKGIEHYETFLNYRRDGSPFMNLVMVAPLYDSRGAIRYFIGAQVDVSGLAMGSYDLGSLKRVADEDAKREAGEKVISHSKDEFTQLAEILGPGELETVRDRGGDMHRLPLQSSIGLHHDEQIALAKPGADGARESTQHARNNSKNRVILGSSGSQSTVPPLGDTMRPFSSLTTAASLAARHNGRLTGVYEHYLLVRPYPSLRILFTSPSMRVPGILQSPLLERIGGSTRMRDQLIQALANGQGVTAKVKWLTVNHRRNAGRQLRNRHQVDHPLEAHLRIDDDDEGEYEDTGRSRWLHCTPLTGSNGHVGVWMIVIVDEEPELNNQPARHIGVSEQTRPESALSDGSLSGSKNQHHTSNDAVSLARHKIRPRRSSETLGSNAATTPSRNEDKSVTKAIHQQHSLNSRAPRPTLQTPGVAARFYSPEVLSLATQAGSSTQQRRENNRSARASREDDGSETPQVWPLPPSSPAGSRRNHREASIRVPSIIRETSSERAVVWGNRSDGDASSIKSQSSAFTVRIGED
ncbi:hypothetical protein ED733_002181 [Metarhizium rileyi]|uniref:PAC domain-containing protein n=1 Tax=Metarhizium rileyi (strain RCEF 4871) TaxID=1649241 RepID=A0A5C6G0H5_METRR|nr:hypothetical protein ED733_002181 [Metarhizium rileyi]